jgi:hypothetical protein
MPGARRVAGSRWRTLSVVAGTAVVPLAALAALSCVLADPPPELPVLPPQAPQINAEAAVPPVGCVASWPSDSNFIVPVSILNSGQGLSYVVLEDYLTPSSTPAVSYQTKSANDSGSFLLTLFLRQALYADAGCHTFTLFVGDGTWVPENATGTGGAGINCGPPLCASIEWATPACGGCPVFDAGALPDAGPLLDAGED